MLADTGLRAVLGRYAPGRGWVEPPVSRQFKPTPAVAGRRQDVVQIPEGEARSASFSEDYVAARRHMNP